MALIGRDTMRYNNYFISKIILDLLEIVIEREFNSKRKKKVSLNNLKYEYKLPVAFT